MGYGDEVIFTSLARRYYCGKKKIAQGDGIHHRWSKHSFEIFKNNPIIARPDEFDNVKWINHYQGNRLYAEDKGTHWKFNKSFKVTQGEIYFDYEEEKKISALQTIRKGLRTVVIEPNVKDIAPNKNWGFDKYQEVADILRFMGYYPIQFVYNDQRKLENVAYVKTETFRESLLHLDVANYYIGPEGGLHHAAAALGKRAVVIFGGFIHPNTTGYDLHENIFIGKEPCGNKNSCDHCKEAMRKITPEMVIERFKRL